MFIYCLNHLRTYGSKPYSDTKVIGYFTAIEKALIVREVLLSKPWFQDYPDGFWIQLLPVPKNAYAEGCVFVVHITESAEDDLCEREYCRQLEDSLEEARAVKDKLIREVGYTEDQIIVGPWELNTHWWETGFGFD